MQSVASDELARLQISHKIEFEGVMEDAANCRLVTLLNQGCFSDVKAGDVDSFLAITSEAKRVTPLNRSKSFAQHAHHRLDFATFELLFEVLLTPTCNFNETSNAFKQMALSTEGAITSEEFVDALADGPVRKLLVRSRSKAFSRRGSLADLVRVDRSLFVEVVEQRVHRDDAFGTFLFTLVYFAIFVCLLVGHLRIFDRHYAEQGMEDWLTKYSSSLVGPNLADHVQDVDSYWIWMSDSGMKSVFAPVKVQDGVARIHLSRANVLIGDALMTHIDADGAQTEAWLLHQPAAVSHLAASSNDFLGAANAAVAALPSLWRDVDATREIKCTFATYSPSSNFYVLNEIRVTFSNSGFLLGRVSTQAVMASSYEDWAMLIVDLLYVIAVVFLLQGEGRDAFHSARLGWREFVDYWNIWNAVDWASISMGLLNVILWALVYVAIGSESLDGLDGNGGYMNLDSDRLHQVVRDLDYAHNLLLALQVSMAVTTIVIALKFFKAYRTNPRLNVVLRTLMMAWVDIVHFFIVFATIFFCFAVWGHVLFGNDLVEFKDLTTSVKSSIGTLLGEFEWYMIAQLEELPGGTFPSGLPRWLLIVWFFLFMGAVLLVLLNMLLAVILQTYVEVAEQAKAGPDSKEIWVQAWEFLKTMKETRGFISLTHLHKDLGNDSQPAHAELVVSRDSLTNAWPTMKQAQAEWIMNMLEHEGLRRSQVVDHSEEAQWRKRTDCAIVNLMEKINFISEEIAKFNDEFGAFKAQTANGKRGDLSVAV